MKKDIFKVGDQVLKSRLIVGTGKYKNLKETARAVRLKVITAFQADSAISTIDAAFIRLHI